jgi:sulfide dehydrogenase cytochrome subunit
MRTKMIRTIVHSLVAAELVAASFLVNAESITEAEMLADQCFACHGTNGVGSGKIPELIELDKDDIMESLNGFKSGSEKSTIMGRHAKAYSDKEIELLADYFVSLKNK